MRRALARAAAVAVVVLAACVLAPPALAGTEKQLLGEAYAQAFTLRATVDYGGSTPLPFFFGSYADAFLSTPPGSADGQASWYNLGIAETALFVPKGECTPEEQQARVQQGIQDMASWITDQAVPALTQGTIPVAPIPTVPCSERLPGFAQSRYPATETIGESSSTDLAVSGLCGVMTQTCDGAQALQEATGGVLQGGSFSARSTAAPSQASDAFVAGLGLAPLMTIGAARAESTTALAADGIVTQATWTLSNLCLSPGIGGCALRIDSIKQVARVIRTPAGAVKAREARTVFAGVSGSGQNTEITASDLGPGLPPIDLGGHLQIQAVSTTGGCGPAGPQVADAGGLLITGTGGSTGVSLPVPLLGTANGGGLLLGGACASGRLQSITIEIPGPPGPGVIDVPGGLVTVPGLPAPGGGSTMTGPQMSGPRVVTKQVVRYVLRGAPAWRTARWWGSALAALVLLTLVGYVFRASRPVAPVAAAIDRFGRQFLRG